MIIPIVFATDDNYVLPLCVAIKSLIDNKNKTDEYIVYVFHNGLSDDSIKLLSKFDYACKIVPTNVNKYIKGTSIYSTGRFPISACFRFFIPVILSQYENVIYLDCDVYVNKSLKSLYEIELENNLLAGNNFVSFFKKDYWDYINSGVLLVNNSLMREESITEKCLEYMYNNLELCNPDEQTLNYVCKNRIKYIDFVFNFHSWYCQAATLPLIGVKKFKDIVVIHYSDKPWDNHNSPFSDLWWKKAKELPKEIYLLIKEKYNFSGSCKPKRYYKYYFASPIKKFFMKLSIKIKNMFKKK